MKCKHFSLCLHSGHVHFTKGYAPQPSRPINCSGRLAGDWIVSTAGRQRLTQRESPLILALDLPRPERLIELPRPLDFVTMQVS